MTGTAFVTGGTGAIGGAIARALAQAGFRTIVAAPDAGAVAPPDGLDARHLDVTDPASIDASLKGIDDLAVLVNAAGITARDGREFELGTFAQVLDVNLTGTMRMCMAAHPLLAARARAGAMASVVNLCSMLSFFGSPTVPAYSASKGGVLMLTKSLAGAWAGDGIRVNAVAPGYIETDLTRPLYDDKIRHDRIAERTPMGRWGKPDEVAGAAVFLCSPAAGFVNGAVINADGGYSAV